mmetsp:Transcript_84554/g.235891  ORF Transcript_84554/g.235891 Transcript_84554/m.235891 type:complete len:269 (-) Transcript_84554:859-1665(-)
MHALVQERLRRFHRQLEAADTVSPELPVAPLARVRHEALPLACEDALVVQVPQNPADGCLVGILLRVIRWRGLSAIDVKAHQRRRAWVRQRLIFWEVIAGGFEVRATEIVVCALLKSGQVRALLVARRTTQRETQASRIGVTSLCTLLGRALRRPNILAFIVHHVLPHRVPADLRRCVGRGLRRGRWSTALMAGLRAILGHPVGVPFALACVRPSLATVVAVLASAPTYLARLLAIRMHPVGIFLALALLRPSLTVRILILALGALVA